LIIGWGNACGWSVDWRDCRSWNQGESIGNALRSPRWRGRRRESQDGSGRDGELPPAPPSSPSMDDDEGSCCRGAGPRDEGSGGRAVVAMIRGGEGSVSSAVAVCDAERTASVRRSRIGRSRNWRCSRSRARRNKNHPGAGDLNRIRPRLCGIGPGVPRAIPGTGGKTNGR
jgi:hypothetical protein